MSITKGDFSAEHVKVIEAEAKRLRIPFAAAVRVILDRAISAHTSLAQPSAIATESLPNRYRGGDIGEGSSSGSSSVSGDVGGRGEGGGIPGREGGGEESPQSSGTPARGTGKGRRKRAPVEEAPPPIPPLEIDSPELRELLPEFARYRREKQGKPMTEGAWTLLLNGLRPHGPANAVVGIRYVMKNSWDTWRPSMARMPFADMLLELDGPTGLPPPLRPPLHPGFPPWAYFDYVPKATWDGSAYYSREEWEHPEKRPRGAPQHSFGPWPGPEEETRR